MDARVVRQGCVPRQGAIPLPARQLADLSGCTAHSAASAPGCGRPRVIQRPGAVTNAGVPAGRALARRPAGAPSSSAGAQGKLSSLLLALLLVLLLVFLLAHAPLLTLGRCRVVALPTHSSGTRTQLCRHQPAVCHQTWHVDVAWIELASAGSALDLPFASPGDRLPRALIPSGARGTLHPCSRQVQKAL